MKEINYVPKNICARRITVTLDENDVVTDIEFEGGCDGNHKGIVSLCIGLKADEVIKKLEGIHCGPRDTSCPDQLAQALKTR